MVDPLSIAIGAGVTLVALLAMLGLFLAGYVAARRPDDIVNMGEVENYQKAVNAARALRNDDRQE